MKTVLLLLFMPLLLSCNIGWTDGGTSVTIQNTMDKPVALCDFSPLEDEYAPVFPVEVAADSECMFETGCSPEQYTFAVEIDGKRYESETRYVQDSRRISIFFTLPDDGGVVCTIDKNDAKGRILELRPVETAAE